MAYLTSDFRVHNTVGPAGGGCLGISPIPGFFIASAIYMIGEKAADVILESKKQGVFK